MPRVGFELTISAGERPQTYALDRTATETDSYISDDMKYSSTVPLQNLYNCCPCVLMAMDEPRYTNKDE